MFPVRSARSEGYVVAVRRRSRIDCRVLVDAGRVCAAFLDAAVRDVKSRRVQVDEIWSFTYAKQKNVHTAKAAPEAAGDTWTWTAIDAESKLIVSWLVGGRDSEYAMALWTICGRGWRTGSSSRRTVTVRSVRVPGGSNC
jgi:hypothetical protein